MPYLCRITTAAGDPRRLLSVHTKSVYLTGILILIICASEKGHCLTFHQGALVAATNCTDVQVILTRQFIMLPGFTFMNTSCDETAEFEAIAQMSLYRVNIVIVSFPSSCAALTIWRKRAKFSSVVIVMGCEEVSWSKPTPLNTAMPVMIQMTTPAWYTARIFQHVAERRAQGLVVKPRWTLIADQSDSTSVDHMLRENTGSIQQYLELGTEEGTVSDYTVQFHRVFICLRIRDLQSFPVLINDSAKAIELFVQDGISLPATISAIRQSKNLLRLGGKAGSIDLFSYNRELNGTKDILAQDIKNSFDIASKLLEAYDIVGDNLDEIRWAANNSGFSNNVFNTLQNFNYFSNLIRLSPNYFAQLYDWKITEVTFQDTNVTDFRHVLTVRVLPIVDCPVRSTNDTTVENTTVSQHGCFGYQFSKLNDSNGADSDRTVSTTDNTANLMLNIYLPVGICSLVFVVGVLIVAAFSRQRYLKAHLSKDRIKFFVESDDLTPISKRTNTVQSVNSASNSKSTNGFMSNGNGNHAAHDVHKSLASIRTTESYGEKAMGLSAGDTYAKFNGDVVFLRYIRTKHLQLKASTRQLIGSMRDLRGDNINAFVAFFVGCSTPFRPPAVVFEYSARGSLMDLIDKEEIKLDWSFKVSFLMDLVRGLKAIQHSPIKFHGRLTSRKCVIDNRWTLKITDYGINRLEMLQNGGKPVENLSDEQLFWTAPEVLRNTTILRDGSPKGDVYSLGIIMQELILRGRPFCTTELSAKEIIAKIRHPPPLLRPHVSNQTAQPEAILIMKECWAENPEIRPTIDEVVAKFKILNQGRKVNIVDSMFVMLEKYSNNLEELIHERTEELNDEKRKTEQLLYRMMPQTVAEKLKIGQPVEPESFADVTIYFSDIVGFTTISAHSTPMEVVNLLNDLYSLFDSTLSFYDVYKVETIGDAYMVVSGLPVANGNKHAGEIASVALDLLYQCGQFKIRHLFDVPLMLRIGIHTGSCAAGVVGLTMPRYCLFGDTVNTASRMESTSRAYRIHVSEESHRKLTELGGYTMVLRGITQVKGKGDMQTFWLEGKTGFDKPLPQPAPDNGENHGLDENLIIQGREKQRTHDAEAVVGSKGILHQTSFDES